MTARVTKAAKALSPRRAVRRFLRGNVVTSEWFSQHWMKAFVLVLLMMVYITTKYQSMTAMERIKDLEKELAVVKTERIRERSTYMSRTRERAMQQLVDSVLPGLGVQEQPPYRIKSDK